MRRSLFGCKYMVDAVVWTLLMHMDGPEAQKPLFYFRWLQGRLGWCQSTSRKLTRPSMPAKYTRQKSILPPPTITKVWFSSYNYKTGYFTSLNFSNRPFYLPRAVLKAVCYSKRSFVFFFFKKNSVESLKNHSKSQKIIK